jgi:hypothetical protein
MGRRIPRDEEVLAATLEVLAREGHVDTQRRLGELVAERLAQRDPDYAVTGERVRRLAVRSGSVDVRIRTREDGATPTMESCPVCGSELEERRNATLEGGETSTGYRCTWCPWWTGQTLRVPRRYDFTTDIGDEGEGPEEPPDPDASTLEV